jgi:hypothetical protein
MPLIQFVLQTTTKKNKYSLTLIYILLKKFYTIFFLINLFHIVKIRLKGHLIVIYLILFINNYDLY